MQCPGSICSRISSTAPPCTLGKDSPPLRLIPTATSLGTLKKRHPFSSWLALGQGSQLAGQSQTKRQLPSVSEAKILCASQIHSKQFFILSVPWHHKPKE